MGPCKKTKGSRGNMARIKERNFGVVIRERRRQLDLTQEEVARRIKTSTPYVGHLESGKRHPSDKVLTRLADVLLLDRRELFFSANPQAEELVKNQEQKDTKSAWAEFRSDSRRAQQARLHLHSEYDSAGPGPLSRGLAAARRLRRAAIGREMTSAMD